MKSILFSLFLLVPVVSTVAETKEWIALLKPENSLEQRARACQRLGEAAGEEAVPALAELLHDPVLNTYSSNALERIGTPLARTALRNALSTAHGVAQLGVVQSLARLRDLEAFQDLAKLTEHESDPLAEAALLALGRLGSSDANAIITKHLASPSKSRREAAGAAGLLAAQEDTDSGAITIYQAILKSDVAFSTRTGAIHQLLLRKKSIPLLMEKIQSEDKASRDTALLALREMPSSDLADTLHLAIKESKGDGAILIAALCDCSNGRTTSFLSNELVQSEGSVREAIINTLAHLGGDHAANALVGIVDEEPARDALLRMSGPEADIAIASELANVESRPKRLRLIEALGQRQAPEALQPLLVQAQDEDPDIRTLALKAIRPFVGFVEIPELIALLRESTHEFHPVALAAIVSACRRSASPKAAGDLILVELEKASGAAGRYPWARVLAAIGHRASLTIISSDLKASDSNTVTRTIEVLGRWINTDPVEYLFNACEKSDYRASAIQAILTLITTHSTKMDQRLEWLKRAQPFVMSRSEKRLFIAALSGTAHSGATALVQPFLKDVLVQAEAEAAMKTLAK
jgi:HEAT repeat protein